MKVTNRIALTVEDIFKPFQYDLSQLEFGRATCVAYQNLGGYDTRAVYEVYIDHKPRFFGVTNLELPESVEAETEFMQKWTNSQAIKLIKDESPDFLFELTSPFGIQFMTK